MANSTTLAPLDDRLAIMREEREDRRSKVRIFATHAAVAYAFGGAIAMVIIGSLLGTDDNIFSASKDVYLATLPTATMVIGSWFEYHKNKNA